MVYQWCCQSGNIEICYCQTGTEESYQGKKFPIHRKKLLLFIAYFTSIFLEYRPESSQNIHKRHDRAPASPQRDRAPPARERESKQKYPLGKKKVPENTKYGTIVNKS